MRTVLAAAALVCALTVTGGCTSSRAGDGRDVVAAFYPLAWAAEEVGGGTATVHDVTPPGAEPHDVELSAREVARLQRADVVLYVSDGFQPAVEKAAGGAAGKRVDALTGLTLRSGTGDEGGTADPHVWLDPVRFARVVRRVGVALGRPRRGDAVAARVLALDREYRDGLAHCARRGFVTSHGAFGYLAARYGLRQIPITGIDPESEPSPRGLQALVDLVRREHVRTVFFERLVSPRLARTVAREAGATTAVLDPIEGLTPAEERRGDTYLSVMRRNLAALREALGCR
jgi:zinc transport system substrate-binding protein